MEVWRKKGDNYNQEFSRTKSNYNSYNYLYKKPPTGGNSNGQQNVPYWEKRFVSIVGSLSWKKFLEAKEYTHLYDNIMKWDDCAGEEAFRTAKDRFFALSHGLECKVEQYNPDLYIDQIDWNAEVDQDLLLDFDSEPVVTDVDSQHEPVVIFGDALPDPYKNYSAGWGDSDEKVKESSGNGDGDGNSGDQNGIKWDDYIDNGRIIWDNCNAGDANKDWWAWNQTDNKAGDQGGNTNTYNNNNYYSSYDNNNYYSSYDNNNYYSSYGNGNNERRVPNNKAQCSNGNNDQRSRSWRNNGNRRSTNQGYGNQRGYGSTFQAHGSQRIHVRP